MKVHEFFDSCRASYFAKFLAAHVEASKRGTLLDWEVLRVDENDNVVKTGSPATGLRTDLLLEVEGEFQPVRVVSASAPTLSRLVIEIGKLRAVFAPFRWDELQLQVICAEPILDVVAGWYDEWFKEAEDFATFPGYCVHYMSDLEIHGQRYTFELDLGSAPAIALEELIRSLEKRGASMLSLS